MKGLSYEVNQLLERYTGQYLRTKAQPAPLVLERAVLQVAVTAGAFAKLADEIPDDLIENMARVEGIVADICPALLRWFALVAELILSDGGEI